MPATFDVLAALNLSCYLRSIDVTNIQYARTCCISSLCYGVTFAKLGYWVTADYAVLFSPQLNIPVYDVHTFARRSFFFLRTSFCTLSVKAAHAVATVPRRQHQQDGISLPIVAFLILEAC